MTRRTFLLLGLVIAASPASAQRRYWTMPLDTLASGHVVHTHVSVKGLVTYVARETDGDVHIRLVSPSGRFIIAECIPALPCALPHVGASITIWGISRKDAEHGWWEVHPVEGWIES